MSFLMGYVRFEDHSWTYDTRDMWQNSPSSFGDDLEKHFQIWKELSLPENVRIWGFFSITQTFWANIEKLIIESF